MRRHLRTLIAGAVTVGCLVVAATPASAAPSNLTGHAIWENLPWKTNFHQVHVHQTTTALRFVLPAPGPSNIYGTYYTRCKVVPPFTATVHYRLNQWPAMSDVRVGVLINNPRYPADPAAVTTERTNNGGAGATDVYVMNGFDTGGDLFERTTTAMSGELSVSDLARNDTIHSFYADSSTGGQLVPLRSDQGAKAVTYSYGARPSTIGLQVWIGDASLYHGPVIATLSGFSLTRNICV
jgi:hypothetical protein